MGYVFILIYNLLAPVIALSYLVFFIISPRRGLLSGLLTELKERFAITAPSLSGRPLWIHAASVGEVKALRGLVPLLRERYPSMPLMITTSTSAGKTAARVLTPDSFLLPLDSYPLMRRFISASRPALLLIAETELWPNLLLAAEHSSVKVMMINARISERTLRFYSFLVPVARLIFPGISRICAQSRADFDRYAGILGGTDKLELTGNIKHDLVSGGKKDRADIQTFLDKARWANCRIFCAASTHAAEEEVLLAAFLKVKEAVPNARLIIAPRHPETSPATSRRLGKRGITHISWSRRGEAAPGTDCLLLDEMGLLSDMYRYSDVVFVGGTLDDTGGHNVLEPAAAAKPVLFGPNVEHTRAGAEALTNKNGGFVIETADQLAEKTVFLFNAPSDLAAAGTAAREALDSLQGATQKTLMIISACLKPPR